MLDTIALTVTDSVLLTRLYRFPSCLDIEAPNGLIRHAGLLGQVPDGRVYRHRLDLLVSWPKCTASGKSRPL